MSEVKRRSNAKSILGWTGSLFVLGVILCITFFFLTLPDVSLLKDQYPIFDRQSGDVIFSKNRPHHWVKYEDVSQYTFGAIIVSEDWTFFSHSGVDWGELKAAVIEWFEEGGRLRGASTLTQQLAKNVFYSSKRSYVRKVREFFTAGQIESVLSKKKILEYYVNIVELGPQVYGVKRAAELYFGKHPRDLNPKESAFLAMLLPSPKRYSQSFRDRKITDFADRTMKRIIRKMARKKMIDPDEVDSWANTLLSFEDSFNYGRAGLTEEGEEFPENSMGEGLRDSESSEENFEHADEMLEDIPESQNGFEKMPSANELLKGDGDDELNKGG